ncbi:hypothetical protein Emag_006613 [Eimeria magna]
MSLLLMLQQQPETKQRHQHKLQLPTGSDRMQQPLQTCSFSTIDAAAAAVAALAATAADAMMAPIATAAAASCFEFVKAPRAADSSTRQTKMQE